MVQQFISDDFIAQADHLEEQQEVLRAILDPETNASTAFDLGLDIPSLSTWYQSLESNA